MLILRPVRTRFRSKDTAWLAFVSFQVEIPPRIDLTFLVFGLRRIPLLGVCILGGSHFAPITIEIARLAGAFDPNFLGDPADRLVAATTIVFRARLVTADLRIRAAEVVETVW